MIIYVVNPDDCEIKVGDVFKFKDALRPHMTVTGIRKKEVPMSFSDSDLTHIAGVIYIEVTRRAELCRIGDGQRTMVEPGTTREMPVDHANTNLQTEQSQVHAIAEVLRRYID